MSFADRGGVEGPPDRYAVIGHPVAHSRSPAIHAAFARQTGEHLTYDRLPAPADGFVATAEAFRAQGGRGLNVTLPFKEEAFRFASRLTPRAARAGAVNTLAFSDAEILGDNTDGAGLVADVGARLGFRLAGASVLLLGAGGAARGVVPSLVDAGIARLVVVNRTVARAQALAALAHDSGAALAVRAGGLDEIAALLDGDGDRVTGRVSTAGWLFLNATATGLRDQAPPVTAASWPYCALAYDMVYAAEPTPFMRQARAAGCPQVADGLGMLVEQAAESFHLWRGKRPHTAPVHAALRAALDEERGAR